MMDDFKEGTIESCWGPGEEVCDSVWVEWAEASKQTNKQKCFFFGMVAHICNPSTLGVHNQPGQHGETPSLLKIQNKLARRGGGRLEAETGESFEPGRWRLQ